MFVYLVSRDSTGNTARLKVTLTVLQIMQDIRLVFMTDDTIINYKVNVQGKNIIEGSGWCWWTRSSLKIRGHREEYGDNGINRKISNSTILLVQRKGWNADKILLAKKEWLLGSIVDWY